MVRQQLSAISIDIVYEYLHHEPRTPKALEVDSPTAMNAFSMTAQLRIVTLQDTLSSMSEEELKEETDRMSGRAMEVESILRVPLASKADIELVHNKLRDSLVFLEQLGILSEEVEANIGTLFQDLLGRADVAIEGG